MLFYSALIIALVLLCVAAVEFFYLMFLDGVVRHHKRRVAELERENARLVRELEEVEELLEKRAPAAAEVWPEVVDEDDFRVR